VDAQPPDLPKTWYAKVYPDVTGATVHRFIVSLGPLPSLPGTVRPIRLPTGLGYRPDLRLLLTDALPGRPVLPVLVREVLATPSGSADAGPVVGLRAAVREAGLALAALHTIRRAAAPRCVPGQLEHELDRELDLVGQVWPKNAAAIRAHCGERPAAAGRAVEQVLCHGDYTPSQVLFQGGQASGLVDFDTVCWGDPAMDLGRFVAHLDLLLGKVHGRLPGPLAHRLHAEFLSGYRQVAPGALDDALLDRVDGFRTLALARSALHACRQLKDRRFELAASLLDTTARTPFGSRPAPTALGG